jgi:hypothetical protein
MVLHEFSPQLLNFLFELTKLPGPKSTAEVASLVRLEGGRRLSSKTVRNWFNYLREPYHYRGYHLERKLSYFPSILMNKLGLTSVYVFYERASPSLLTLFPMRFFVGRLYDTHSNERVLAVAYIVPVEHLSEFASLLGKVKEAGLSSRFTCYATSPNFKMNSPWHKTVDGNGTFHPEHTDPDEVNRQVGRLQTFLEVEGEPRLSPAIKENPLIIPVIAEYLYELRSSVQVWKAIKTKLGDAVWAYLRHSKRRSDTLGVKRVQALVRNLQHYGLVNQMRVVYFPFEIGRNLMVWMFGSYGDKSRLSEMARTMLVNSMSTQVSLIGDGKAFFATLVDAQSLQNLFEPFSSASVERLFLFDYSDSVDLVTTTRYSIFDYAGYFDPESCAWRYNQDLLVSELEGCPR